MQEHGSLPIPVEKKAKPSEPGASSSKEAKPTKPSETGASSSKEAKPTKPSETGVSSSKEAKPAKPSETGASSSKEAKPAKPSETGVSSSKEAKPAKPIVGETKRRGEQSSGEEDIYLPNQAPLVIPSRANLPTLRETLIKAYNEGKIKDKEDVQIYNANMNFKAYIRTTSKQ